MKKKFKQCDVCGTKRASELGGTDEVPGWGKLKPVALCKPCLHEQIIGLQTVRAMREKKKKPKRRRA